ncbi:MAG TPA: GlsB/YeaQ/YmgE family stress response membrane protein [Ramlibacter sp.]|uniref:GlsB/YeaQ/YmgE family stress response membrane protein n=1 Tax=Ramlibacter sp. TaxID=1917967 RepID=UPI002ED69E45
MSIIGTIIVGFVVGLLARALKPGNDRMGIILTTLLGIAGAFLASFVGQAMGWYRANEPAGWIASVIGAIVLLVIVAMFRRPRNRMY